MLVTIISAVHSLRLDFIKEYYTSRGYEVENITLEKKSVQSWFAQINVSKKIRKTVRDLNPDIVYCEALFDLLIKELGVLKRKNNNMKLIFDVCEYSDSLHQKYLSQADVLFCSNELYRGYIHGAILLYPINGQNCVPSSPELMKDEISFCIVRNDRVDNYLILSFLRECCSFKPCVLHIIGDWKQKDSFIQDVLSVGANVVDHKVLPTQARMQEVFDQCQYALNMKKYDGLNKESLDYMCGQIPIINSVNGDLKNLCELWDIGMNIDNENYKQIAEAVCKENDDVQLKRRNHIRNLYNTYFTKEIFFETLDKSGGSL